MVVPSLVDSGTCARVRAMMDGILGESCEYVEGSDLRIHPPTQSKAGFASNVDRPAAESQGGGGGDAGLLRKPDSPEAPADDRWPARDATEPYISSGNFTHSILHPINDAAAASIVPPMVDLHLDLLRCSDATNLKLLNQNFRRTDRSPPPGAAGAGVKQGWCASKSAPERERKILSSSPEKLFA